MKKWMILQKKSNNKEQISETELIKILLNNRGINNKKEIEEFLNPSLKSFSIEKADLARSELDKAAKRIKRAIKNKESIIVYTDYDVDGVCSGTIVWEALFDMGAKVMPYVPLRVEEGYGLSEKGIDSIYKEFQTKLIITVDHGISAFPKVKYAKKLGIDVIIIDHHTLSAKIPKAVAIVHTTNICATAVAWFFVRYLKKVFADKKLEENSQENLDLVALATISDLIPLKGINRVFVKFGLESLNKTKRIGLLALIRSCRLTLGNLGVYEVGHMLAPRINASGRITHAMDSLRLLCTKDRERADLLADKLTAINKDRQKLLEEAIFHAKNTTVDYRKNKLIFLTHASYNQGVIGLVAGKLVEEYCRPAVVVSRGEKYSKASARSVAGFNIVEAVRKYADLLVDVGGHPMAAGFTIETSKLSLFEKKLVQHTEKCLTEEDLQKVLKIEHEINIDSVNLSLYKNIQKLSPFGMGNPQPVFVSYGVKLLNAVLVGRDKNHLKLVIKQNSGTNRQIEAIGFGFGDFFHKLIISSPIDIAYTIDKNDWNRRISLQLILKDVKLPH